ncbi:MAG: carbohydrate kinase family protein [Persicimonas sp.]
MTETNPRDFDVLSFGEALVDFLPDQRGPLREVESFRRVVGGAPANVAVGLARLGREVAFLGKVGDDEFGAYVDMQLTEEGVDVAGLDRSKEAKTGITFVSLDESGDRSFMFFREPSADLVIGPDDIDDALVARCSIVHLGSNLMTEALPLAATMRLLDAADAHGCVISCDPNLRLHLWPNADADKARAQIDRLVERAELIKLNDDELDFVADGGSVESLWHERLRPAGALALLVTHAERGAEVFCGDTHVSVDAPNTEVVDTTGAGDGFMSGFLAAVTEVCGSDGRAPAPSRLREQLAGCDDAQWTTLLEFACAAGSTACRTLGATPGLARRDELPDLAR